MKLACAALIAAAPLLAEGLLPVLSTAQVAAARRAVQDFKENPRGPYARIKWFCKDGSTAPVDGSCASVGGGYQHGDLSDLAKQLHDMQIHVGTVLADNLLAHFSTDSFIDSPRDYHRLKELILEKYLVEVDRGWIYRKSVSYRGARQIEDEEKAGRFVLTRILANTAFLERNYYLAQQLVDAIPHGVPDNAVKRIRTLAADAASADNRFQGIRAKIHSYPGPEDLGLVKAFIEKNSPSGNAKKPLDELAALLSEQQNPARWFSLLDGYKKVAAGTPVAPLIDELATALRERGGPAVLEKAATLSLAIGEEVRRKPDGRRNLELLDLNSHIQSKAFEWRRGPEPAARASRLRDIINLARLATGAGLLSPRQLQALQSESDRLSSKGDLSAEQYRSSIRYLGRAVEWCRATVGRDFGPVAHFYEPVEPISVGLIDHLLRSSIALSLTANLDTLLVDADRAAGIRHSLLGQDSSAGVVGLNPGVATGQIGIIENENQPVDPRRIYVIPETVSDLKPMAGILTLDSGNLLSHAQLLAANLGIPNAVIPSSLKPAIQAQSGKDMFFAVTPRGVVVLKPIDSLTPEEARVWARQPAEFKRVQLDTSRLNLADKRLHPLTELGVKDSGVICGPKAANLGQLASYFPDRVAPGTVIPFGIFHDHINRVLDDSGKTLRAQITEMVIEVERMRDRNADPQSIAAFAYPRLARIRATIEKMPLLPGLEAGLRQWVKPGTGYYVRSDTNAEDLPQFTGAGLNLTLPNEVGLDNILKAVRRVWASPFTERAFDWRSRALKGTDQVYPSVIVMRAVPNDKSGVIATVDLESGDQRYITVNASEGVSAVVDGGVAESLLLAPDGGVRLLQQCRATYRKVVSPKGGFDFLPALGKDTLLEPAEIAQLRAMVAQVHQKYPAVRNANGLVLPWDIEFGFEKGDLRLLQIRPLARFQELKTLEALTKLEATRNQKPTTVRLTDQVQR